MKYAAIADWAAERLFPVTFMCAQLGIARSGYYRWLASGASQRERDDAELSEIIRTVYKELEGNPGVRRVWAELVVLGHRVSRKRVWRLMKTAGLQGRHPKAGTRTTVQGEDPAPVPDLIGRDFVAEAPNTRWCGDITYIRTVQGWAYLATVIDLHSRKLVGWAIDDTMRTPLIIKALHNAIATRKPSAEVIFHSDRGSQYTSHEFAQFCERNGVKRSMGRTGVCWDNAVAESFFATYKKELIHTRPWNDLAEVKQHTFWWIEAYYNRRRRHSTLDYLTPEEYELGFRNITELAA